METTTELGERLSEISNGIEVLLERKNLKRLDGNGWKAYRVGNDIRVDVEDLNKEEVTHG